MTIFFNNIVGVSDAFAIVAFGFMNHHNSFLLYHSLDDKKFKRGYKISNIRAIRKSKDSFLTDIGAYNYGSSACSHK